MRLVFKVAIVFVIAILIGSLACVIFFTGEENKDTEAPTIDSITGGITGTTGKITTISVTFSDNIEVIVATMYYKTESDDSWSNTSILSGSADIVIPSDSDEDWYYYVVVDDEAGNGPVGDPSTDGSSYYTITVLDDDNGDGEFTHTVFVEEGSFTDCQYCPFVANILYELYSSGDYNFYYVTLIKNNEKATDRLDNEYNLYGLPTVFIDGGFKVIMGGKHEKSEYAQAIRDAETRNAPKIQVTINAEYDNDTNSLISNVVVKNKEDETYDGRIRVYLTEIVSRWSGTGGEPYHYGLLDYIINEEISVDADEDVSFKEVKDISDLDPENLMVMAVVFNSEKKQGFSDPPNNQNPFDAYYTDAVDATEVLEGGNLPPTVGFSLPEIGKLHILGIPIYKFKLHKTTVLIGKTKLVAKAEDDTGIEKVEFYINGNLVSEDTEEPYEYDFRKVKLFKRFVKKYTISVIAYDNEGKTGTGSIEVIALIL